MAGDNKNKSFAKKIIKALLSVVLVFVIAAAAGIGVLTVFEYRPEDKEDIELIGTADKILSTGDSFTVLTWNTGYGALSDDSDFFMDGGTMVYTADKDRVQENLEQMAVEIESIDPDIVFLQEVDKVADRSYKIDEVSFFQESNNDKVSSYALNMDAIFIPYPIPPIGRVKVGIQTLSAYEVSSSTRLSLPVPFKWPVSTCNFKKCLNVSRIPVEGTDKELVLVNLHLEAYDSGEGKIAQTNMLRQILQAEVDAGNYVIAGGDFNQVFSNTDTSAYPVYDGLWQPGSIDVAEFGDDFTFITDSSVPTCRSLDKVYLGADKDSFQYYIIDGFIVSDNIAIDSCKTQDLGFVNSDHNPVVLEVTLM
ncbi:endonuclease/exonuclease/phosphatase family protein [Butyrivibrio fibrisolvens]|uniref:endonuclease/exonuclease/phosphatase family protein n=1 Tax=Butyrivibrio fibrisolvens TaxID=831 RepID=UPI00040C3342|nr:endonuclease/exonuclease/phosphatase family protein [Butyrivibrio fibrisolvens]